MPAKKNKKKADKLLTRLRKYVTHIDARVFALLVLALMTIALLAASGIAKHNEIYKEQTQFIWANAKISIIQSQINKTVESVNSMKQGERCYHNEGLGPYNKGILHCEVSLKGTYAVKDYRSFSNTKSLLGAIVYSKDNFGMGVQSLTDTSDGLYFSEQNMTCGINNDSMNPANFESSKDATGNVTFDFSIYCDQRSHKEYFPVE